MKLLRSLGGALSLAVLFGLMVSSVPAGAQTLTALSLERTIALNNILTTITPSIPASLLASLAGGALEVREQSNYNPQQNTLTDTVFVVPTGAPNPTNLLFLPNSALVAQTTLSIDRIYLSSKPAPSVLFVGTISQSTATPYGNYLGATADFSFGYTTDTPPKIQNVIETIAGTIVLYSASSGGTFTITQPPTPGGGVTSGIVVTVNGQTGAKPNFTTTLSTLVLSASATSANPGALTYSWTPAPGSPSFSITGGSTSTVNVTLGTGKGVTYTLLLTVTDSTGATSTSTITILFI